MKLEYFTNARLSPAAEELVQFDIASIRMVVASLHGADPEAWLADPESYEKNGRIQRDSPVSRLLAYSPSDRIVYACDGCNACVRRLEAALESMTPPDLESFAADNSMRLDLLQHLARIRQ